MTQTAAVLDFGARIYDRLNYMPSLSIQDAVTLIPDEEVVTYFLQCYPTICKETHPLGALWIDELDLTRFFAEKFLQPIKDGIEKLFYAKYCYNPTSVYRVEIDDLILLGTDGEFYTFQNNMFMIDGPRGFMEDLRRIYKEGFDWHCQGKEKYHFRTQNIKLLDQFYCSLLAQSCSIAPELEY